ncbi:hypothetical protein DENSPDRAFT_460123 [Dentipellis sp. KUC8613]|nr:hypothetical protein DENSPDRAFT_460123 [Dentipellis sp. KUC8613]
MRRSVGSRQALSSVDMFQMARARRPRSQKPTSTFSTGTLLELCLLCATLGSCLRLSLAQFSLCSRECGLPGSHRSCSICSCSLCSCSLRWSYPLTLA